MQYLVRASTGSAVSVLDVTYIGKAQHASQPKPNTARQGFEYGTDLVEVPQVEGVQVGVLVRAHEVHWLLRVPRHRV